ncbi:MAG: F0F1 ATP synthase subunit delta [Candidatus Dormibacteraeota bacterium]|nr:F0F1 ATP synthase subunit delta [Candidatus Dormibacteraeota bacterium]
MAAASSVARRYAAAYFDLAKEAGDIAAWRDELAAVAEALSADEVAEAVINPKLPLAERTRLGLQLLDGVAEPARNLARLLIERRRSALLREILTHYDSLADQEAGVVRAEVTAAVPVDRKLEHAITEALASRLGRSVETTVRSDPAIVGGLVIRIGDRVIDDSVRTHLQQLQAALA